VGGWTNFDQKTPTAYLPVNHLQDGSDIDVAFTYAVLDWNSYNSTYGTVPLYSFNYYPQIFPDARVVPYRVAGDAMSPLASEYTYDFLALPRTFTRCNVGCTYPAQLPGEQLGYDLSEISFFDYKVLSRTIAENTRTSKHELGHTAGLKDHSCGGSYAGLMVSSGCGVQSLSYPNCQERYRVNWIHQKYNIVC